MWSLKFFSSTNFALPWSLHTFGVIRRSSFGSTITIDGVSDLLFQSLFTAKRTDHWTRTAWYPSNMVASFSVRPRRNENLMMIWNHRLKVSVENRETTSHQASSEVYGRSSVPKEHAKLHKLKSEPLSMPLRWSSGDNGHFLICLADCKKSDDGLERQTGNKKQKVFPNDLIATFCWTAYEFCSKLEDRPFYLATFMANYQRNSATTKQTLTICTIAAIYTARWVPGRLQSY